MQTVTSADGTEITYERHSDGGRPLVLLHGGASSRYWEPVMPAFADDYTVVTPGRRGYGESDDADDYSLEREIEDVRAVLEAIREEGAVDGATADPVLFGHSFGGLQAIETARVESVAATIAYEPAIIVGEYAEQADLASQMRERIDAGERREAAKLHVREIVYTGPDDDEAFEQWLEAWDGWPGSVERVERTTAMNFEVEAYNLPAELDVDAPALVMTGTEGPQHLRDSARAAHESLPHSRFVDFDGVSHVGPLEAPERVVDEVRAFLRHRVGE